jgi:glycosyltransferase involved in cell wall biosynthesis
MKLNFLSPVTFEPWDYRNYDTQGIGGSETAICELAWRLAARGHEIKVYAPVPEDCTQEWRGTHWFGREDYDPQEQAVWVLCRCPEAAARNLAGEVWVQCQDQDYPGRWVETAQYDRVLALCEAHVHYLSRYPFLQGHIWQSSNAVRTELLTEVEAEGLPERNPNKCIWTSSPDRGLIQYLLPNWRRIREFAPTAEMHVYYGFNNIDNMIRNNPEDPRITSAVRMRSTAMRLFEELAPHGVVWHGRLSQRELYRELLTAGVWTQFSEFAETSCINCMEAQCAGAIPVTYPTWAVAENVRHGFMVGGTGMGDPLTQAELVQVVAGLVNTPELQETIRAEMMPEARARCGWDHVVDQYEAWLKGDDAPSPQQVVWQWV